MSETPDGGLAAPPDPAGNVPAELPPPEPSAVMPPADTHPPDAGPYCWRCGLQPGAAVLYVGNPAGLQEVIHSNCPGPPAHPDTGAPLTPDEVLAHVIPQGAIVLPLPLQLSTAAAASVQDSSSLPTEAGRDPLDVALGGGAPLPSTTGGEQPVSPPVVTPDLTVDPSGLSPEAVAAMVPVALEAVAAGETVHPVWRNILDAIEDDFDAMRDKIAMVLTGGEPAPTVESEGQGVPNAGNPPSGEPVADTPATPLPPPPIEPPDVPDASAPVPSDLAADVHDPTHPDAF